MFVCVILVENATYFSSSEWVAVNGLRYRMVGNFGGNLFWRIAEICVFGGIYFGGLAKPVP